jgi:hypothetical protein
MERLIKMLCAAARLTRTQQHGGGRMEYAAILALIALLGGIVIVGVFSACAGGPVNPFLQSSPFSI